MKVRDYRDLIVWQRAMALTDMSYDVARQLPIEERFDLASQIRRAAVSVCANIVEGHSRPHRGEFLHFLGIARASLKELDNHLTIAERAGYVRADAPSPARLLSDEVGRMLWSMRKRLAESPRARKS